MVWVQVRNNKYVRDLDQAGKLVGGPRHMIQDYHTCVRYWAPRLGEQGRWRLRSKWLGFMRRGDPDCVDCWEGPDI